MKVTVVPKSESGISISDIFPEVFDEIADECGIMQLEKTFSGGKVISLLKPYASQNAESNRTYSFIDDFCTPEFYLEENSVVINADYYEKSAFVDAVIASMVKLSAKEVHITDKSGTYKIDDTDYVSFLSEDIDTGTFLRIADPLGRNRKSQEEKEALLNYMFERGEELDVSPDDLQNVLDYDRKFDEREMDDYIPFWKPGDKKLFRPDTQKLFSVFASRYFAWLHKSLPEAGEELVFVSSLLSFLKEKYGYIFCFKDFYEDTIKSGFSAEYMAAWMVLNEMAHDDTFLFEGGAVCGADGKILHPWHKIDRSLRKNGSRVYLRSYLGLLHNQDLRKRILRF